MLVAILQISVVLNVIAGASWSYSGVTGPTSWAASYSTCGGDAQSPIDLPYKKDMAYNPDLGNITLDYNTTTTVTLRNNRHGAQMDLDGDMTITGGGLDDTFKAAEVHLHWGSNSTLGSEHTYHGNKYPMELQIVHYNTEYADLATALDEDDGLAVLAFFFEIQTSDNTAYTSIVNALPSILNNETAVALPPFNLLTLLPSDMSKFYRYQGGLTTPACYESVTWTLFQDTIKISEYQLAQFRTLLDSSGEPTVDNYRPVQPRNKRNVFVNYEAYTPKWSYHGTSKGPDTWSSIFPECGTVYQSPIDFPHRTKMTYAPSMGDIHMSKYDDHANYKMTLMNKGYGVNVDLHEGSVMATQGGLPGTFKAEEFHFHWGADSSAGSEHTYNGKKYPLELHVIHYNTKYDNISTAFDKPDGLAVFGFLFEVSNRDNCHYEPLLKHMDKIKYSKSIAAIDSFNMRNLMSEDMSRYYRYKGGLTTPGCHESVTWTVFEETIKISEQQLRKFREVLNTTGQATVDNYRPVQPLENRIVYVSYNTNVNGAPSISAQYLVIVLLASAITLV